ncbi:MAG: hypothetical protein Q9211_000354 [Gyalolechia sp. 1 TL-2023]
MASLSSFDTHLADQKVKTLVNAQLKAILKREKLAVSGLKAAMQNRIIGQLHSHARNGDMERLNRLKGFINNPEALQSPAHSLSSNHISYHDFPGAGQKLNLPPLMHQGTTVPVKPVFKESPFYTILKPLTAVQECKVREATRDQVECKITLESDVTDKLTTDPTIRVMVFSASEPISHFSKVDIAFPHQVEVKVNMDEVKANLRGLKNRPGSTRPADITTLLRKRANYENSLSLTYALTHKKFYFVVNLVKQHSVGELVTKLKSGRSISKEQVVREIQPDGKWSRIAEGEPSPRRSHDSSEDDEELVEIKDPPRVTAVKYENNNGASLIRTPPASSREQSYASVPPISAGAKRPVSAVIDLTSDDDDDDGQISSKRPTMPAHPATPNYARSESTHLPPRAEDSTPLNSYVTNLLSKPNYFHGGYAPPP